MHPSLPFDAPLSAYQQHAEALFILVQSADTDALWSFKWMHPRFRGKTIDDVIAATLNLEDAKLLLARNYFLHDWETLASYTEAVQHEGPVRLFETAVEAVVAGDVAQLQTLLHAHPELVKARSTRSHHATLLHYTAANGVENVRQKTPAHAVEVAQLLLASGAEADALADMYDSQCTTMSMLVSSCHPHAAGLQVRLAETLMQYGAQLNGAGTNWQSAVLTALIFGYRDTAEALQQHAEPIDSIVIAAGLGRVAETTLLLSNADALARHQALALAALLGQVETLRVLLDAGEDPNRLNPEGYHSHATPLHQAVSGGHVDAVKLLVERGARLDTRDTIYQSTPLGWAQHGNDAVLVTYLQGIAAGS